MRRDALERHLDQLLDCSRFKDYGPNGLQVEGRDEIGVLATATTASRAACQAAVDAGASALLVHHGLFWGGSPTIRGMLRTRLGLLLEADCSLFAYHLPLDAHTELGNNATALAAIGCSSDASFGEFRGVQIGRMGRLKEPETPDTFIARLGQAFGHGVVHCPGDQRPIRTVGVVTGAGQSHLLDAAAAGCDCLVTGEVSEQSWHEAAESGCHLFACGHHATEALAVHALGRRLAAEFGLHHVPINLNNPI